MSYRTIALRVARAVSLTAAILWATPALAATGNITGSVTNHTGAAVAGASVVVDGTTLGATTGPDGAYAIERVPEGRRRVVVYMLGYQSVSEEVNIIAATPSVADFHLDESTIDVGCVVVTGTRTPRYVADSPVRTEVITAQTIENKAAPDLYSALEGLPGVRVEQQCSACNFSQVRMLGLEAGHTQVLIDGQQTYSGLASVYGLQQVTTTDIDRIEVVKGAGSAMYGSSAIAGVVNIITREPTGAPTIDLAATLGSYGTNTFSASASRSLGRFDVSLTAQKNTGDEIDEDGDGATDRVETDDITLGFKVRASDLLGVDDRLTLTGRTLNETRQGGDLLTWENPFAAGSEYIITSRYELGALYERRLRTGGELSLNLGYTSHDRSATNDAFLGDYESIHGTLPGVAEMEPYLANETGFVANLSLSHPFSFNRFIAGVDYAYNELDESGRYVIVDEQDPGFGGTYTSESNKHANDVGFYLHDEIAINNAVELAVGARYDIHRSEDEFGGSGSVAPQDRIAIKYDEHSVNPRAAAKVRLSPTTTIRASVGTGFRVPYGFSEDLHLCSGSPRVNKPEGLVPEKSVSYTLGADYVGRRVNANVNVFRTDLSEMIGIADASDASAALGYTYEWANVGDAYTQGVELGLRTQLLRDLVLDLNATYTDAQYDNERSDWAEAKPEYAEDSRYIPRVPAITGGIQLSYSPGNWDAVLGADYTGRMYIDYYEDGDLENPNSKIEHTPDFWIVNAKLSRSFGNGVTLFAGARNLFDYVQDERHPDDAAYIYAPITGRIIYAGMKLHLSG